MHARATGGSAIFLAAVVPFQSVCAGPSSGTIDVISLGARVAGGVGDPVPDGEGSFFNHGVPGQADGVLAFAADLTVTGVGDDTGLFRWRDGVMEILVRQDDPSPDFNGIYSIFSGGALVNSNGDVAYRSTLLSTLGGPADSLMINKWPGDGGNVQIVARGGDPVPGGDGDFGSAGAMTINEAGDVAFAAALQNTINFSGIFVGDGENLTKIAQTGDPINGETSTVGLVTTSLLSMNESGTVAFNTFPFGGNSSLLIGDGTSVDVIVASGDPAPGDSGGMFVFPALTQFGITEDDRVAFVTTAQVNGQNEAAVFIADINGVDAIMRKGDILPNNDGLFLNATFDNGTFGVNSVGRVAFAAQLTGTSQGQENDLGIFTGDENNLTEVVREGDIAPGGEVEVFVAFDSIAINDAGEVAFRALIEEPDTIFTDKLALFYWSPQDGLREIIREGDSLAGGTTGDVFMQGSTPTSLFGQGSGTQSLDEDGRVAFKFFAGPVGLAVWSPGVDASCPGDLDEDQVVGFTDLVLLLGQWQQPGSGDLDESGTVDFADLVLLLNLWGDC